MNTRLVAALLRELADALERGEESCLYFIRAQGGPIKIGIAGAPTRRREELQPGNHLQLRLVHWVPGGRPAERLAHDAFAPLRIRGEWFRPEPVLLDFIFTLIEGEAA